jgi:hypothetical protein
VGAADSSNLLGVMAGVDEVKTPPLLDGEWAKDLVADGGAIAEGGPGLVEDGVHCEERLMELLQELWAAERLNGRWGTDHCWRGAALRKEATGDQGYLGEALFEVGVGRRRATLGETTFDCVAGGAKGKEQVLSDLLDGPLFWVGDGTELGLLGVEGLEGGAEGLLELEEESVHAWGKATGLDGLGARRIL